MSVEKIIRDFISIISPDDSKLTESDIIELLINKGHTKNLSFYATFFIPIVIGRIIGGKLQANFQDIYYEHFPNGTQKKSLLSENNFYIEINRTVINFLQNGWIPENVILKIAYRSPEIKVLSDFMNVGKDPGDIQFSSLQIVW